MSNEIIISQINFEFKSFIDYAKMNLDPSNREDQFKINIMDKLKTSIKLKLDLLSEVKN